MIRYPNLRKLVLSTYLDVIGASLVFVVCVWRGFHGTVYQDGAIQFGVPFSQLPDSIQAGAFPLGILSLIGAIFSMLSTRFISKQSNIGNIIGVFTAINSGAIDYMFGNHSAVITYPVSFALMSFASINWAKGERIRKRDLTYYLIIILGMILGFGLVYLGAHLFGGRVDHLFLITVSITFGLSIGANTCSALKYEETWLSWMIYNVVQLTKNSLQLNLANIVKYIFYLFNATITLFDWKYNGDIKKIAEAKS